MNSFTLSLFSGGIGFVLVLVTAFGGLKILKMGFKIHRALGISVLAWACLHGLGALLAYFGIL